jgi:hypothetical protein
MASGAPNQFLFLHHSLSSTPSSQREKELQDADRRAHAARNSVSRRRRVPVTVSNHGRSRIIPTTSHLPWADLKGEDAQLASKHEKNRRLKEWRVTPAGANESRASDFGLLTSTVSIGQGNHDPFDTASISGLPPFIYASLDYCK